MAAFNDENGKKDQLAERFEAVFGAKPIIDQATAPPKSKAELKKDEEELAHRFKLIFGKEPMVNQANRPPKSKAELKKGEDELAQRFKSIFGKKPMVYDDDDADNNTNNNNVNTRENSDIKVTYDCNDDDIDLLFAETEYLNDGEIVQDTDILLSSLSSMNGSKADSVNVNNIEKNTVHMVHLMPQGNIISDEAEDLIRQTKEKMQLGEGKNTTTKYNHAKSSDTSKFLFNNADDFNNDIDDEVREVIIKANEEARLDKKFGLSQKETQPNGNEICGYMDDDNSDEESSVSSDDEDY